MKKEGIWTSLNKILLSIFIVLLIGFGIYLIGSTKKESPQYSSQTSSTPKPSPSIVGSPNCGCVPLPPRDTRCSPNMEMKIEITDPCPQYHVACASYNCKYLVKCVDQKNPSNSYIIAGLDDPNHILDRDSSGNIISNKWLAGCYPSPSPSPSG